MKKIVINTTYALIVLSLANLAPNTLATFAQQLHQTHLAKPKGTVTSKADPSLQAETGNLIKEKKISLLKDAVGFALSALPKTKNPEDLKKVLQHLYELNVLAREEYNKLPGAHTAQQKKERETVVYDLALLPITRELVKAHVKGQINLNALKSYLAQGSKNLTKIAEEIANTGHNK